MGRRVGYIYVRWHLVNSTPLCVHHSLLKFKVVHRAHLSKSKLSKIHPGLDPRCNRCGSDDANHTHMFWTCPAFAHFREEFFVLWTRLLTWNGLLTPLFAVFATEGEDDKYIIGAKHHLLSHVNLFFVNYLQCLNKVFWVTCSCCTLSVNVGKRSTLRNLTTKPGITHTTVVSRTTNHTLFSDRQLRAVPEEE